MYQEFSIVDIQTDLANNVIKVFSNFDIEEKSVNDSTVQLFDMEKSIPCVLEYKVDTTNITIRIVSGIEPNKKYNLRIMNIENILGETLQPGVRRFLSFKPELREKVEIVCPADYEAISNLNIELSSEKSDSNESNEYNIQISTDVAFFDIEMETTIQNKKANLQSLKLGQYYVRARAVKDNKNGEWSKVKTFIIVNASEKNDYKDDEPEYVDFVELKESPLSGETPKTIILEFDGEIDETTLNEIVIIRRDI